MQPVSVYLGKRYNVGKTAEDPTWWPQVQEDCHTPQKPHLINCKHSKTPEQKQFRQKVQEFGVPPGV